MCHHYVTDTTRHERLREESTQEADEQVAAPEPRDQEPVAPADD